MIVRICDSNKEGILIDPFYNEMTIKLRYNENLSEKFGVCNLVVEHTTVKKG